VHLANHARPVSGRQGIRSTPPKNASRSVPQRTFREGLARLNPDTVITIVTKARTGLHHAIHGFVRFGDRLSLQTVERRYGSGL